MTTPALADPPAPGSGFYIRRVAIRNFRCIDDLQLELESGTTYLVGENNAGKTSIRSRSGLLWEAVARWMTIFVEPQMTLRWAKLSWMSSSYRLKVSGSRPSCGSASCTSSGIPPRERRSSGFVARSSPVGKAPSCQPEGPFSSRMPPATGPPSTPPVYLRT